MGQFFEELKRRNVLRVAIAYLAVSWLLIQLVETLFPIFGLSDALIRLVVILLIIGFPLIMIFSWVYELTPGGLKLGRDVDRSRSVVHHTGKRLDRVIIVVLTLGLGYFAFDKFVLDPARDELRVQSARQVGRTEALVESYGDKSIAVLPFADMSPEGDQEYLSDGIAEELLNLMAKIPEFRVISRSSAFSFKGKNLAIPEIANRLNVAHILEGSVRKDGNRVRITAQLIEAHSDMHLWSKTYDRTLDDIFAIQDKIAAAVVAQLKVTLLGNAPKAREHDGEAYALYLQARYLSGQRTPDTIEQSKTLYEQALAIDPEFAAAWVGLAHSYSQLANEGLHPFEEAEARAREAAEKALAIDLDHAPAHAFLASDYDDIASAARHMDHALSLEPGNVAIIGHAAALLVRLGRLDEAIELEEYAAAIDPVNPGRFNNLGNSYYLAGRWDESIATYRIVLRLSPNYISAHFHIGAALLFKGDEQAALAEFKKEKDDEYRVKGTAMALYALGRQSEYEDSLAELIERWGEKWPSEIAHVYAFSGDTDSAFAWLDKELELGFGIGTEELLQPYHSTLRLDPRWETFLKRADSLPEQLEAIEFEVTIPD